ncbi:MAG TPA: TetR/AcrR family transcriptional regulator [Deltaproteobacteria bacterium]|nr:TetR/AcrR family transcriptional regulator [Deltaproteobacteria bacterium]
MEKMKMQDNEIMNLKGNTKQKILDIAESLLAKKGFNGFSYKHISSLLGIKNAAVHYHFPTKSDLGVDLILRARIRFQEWAADIDSQDLKPTEKMEAFFGLYRNLLQSEGRVFFAAAVEANFKILPDEMQQEARMLVFGYISWLENVLRQGREDGQFSFQGTALEQAHMIWAILNGTVYLVQMIDKSCLDTAIRQIWEMLK